MLWLGGLLYLSFLSYFFLKHNMYVPIHIHVGVLCCFALFVCLTLLASFFLPSHLSFKNIIMRTYISIHAYTHVQLLLSITSLMLRHMIHEISDYRSSGGSCLSRNHSKTSPTLVNVTPAPVPVPYTSPHEAWSLENNPFMQGFNNHNVPRLAPPVATTTAIATHSQRRRHDERMTRHLNSDSTQL